MSKLCSSFTIAKQEDELDEQNTEIIIKILYTNTPNHRKLKEAETVALLSLFDVIQYS